MKNVDIKKLRAFQMVARLGSLRRAASRLLVTMPAVSIQLRQLEDELGVQLFSRLGKRLTLSPAGELFLLQVETVLDAYNNAIASVSMPTNPKGRVSIAIGTDLAGYFAAPISRFVKDYPDVELSMRGRVTRDAMALVSDGEIDLGIGYFATVPPEVNKRIMGQSGYSFVFSGRHPLVGRRNVGLDQISKQRLLVPPLKSYAGMRIERAFSQAGIQPEHIFEVGNCHTAREFAENGIGVAIIHTNCLIHKRPKTLHAIDASQHFGTVDMAVIHRRSLRLSAAHVAFLQMLEATGKARLTTA